MKRGPILIFLIAVAAAGGGLKAAGAFSPALLVMADGRRVAADQVQVQGEAVVYRRDGVPHSAPKKAVQAVLTGFPRTRTEFGHRLAFAAGQIQHFGGRMSARGPVWLPAAVILAAGLILGGNAIIWLRRKRAAPVARPAAPASARNRPVLEGPRLAGMAEVEQFFLDLYRRQINAPPGAPGRIQTVGDVPNSPFRICRLRIRLGDDWRDRRMTIGPIGEGTGSRSQCFYVIFDTHMVIKIPPAPVRDFADYLQRIRYESALVARLAPRECIIPTVSVILKRIRRLPGTPASTPAAVEARYIELLEREPEYRDCLRVGGGFAFFMDLSRHRFLGQVLADLDVGQRILAETAASDAALLADCQGFEARYGDRHGWICYELQRQSRRFEAAARNLPEEDGGSGCLPGHRLREIFLARHAGADTADPGMPPALLEKLGRLFPDDSGTENDAARAYGTIARAYSEQKVFARNRAPLEALSTRLLDLLAWLAKKGIAMRDLKPDNLLVAGDGDDYPLFLASAQAFTIGMIDLETAVDFMPEQGKSLAQPQLGGTPAYATPTHFLPNRILGTIYPDLARVLHFQDWHAVTGIIFEAVTGRRLFPNTANQIPRVMVRLRQAVSRGQSLADAFTSANASFWALAEKEFDARTGACRARLSAVRVPVPGSVRRAIQAWLDRENASLADALDRCRARPCAPASEKDRRTLLGCTPAQIQRLQGKYRHSGNPSHQRACVWLDDLFPLKLRLETVTSLQKTLAGLPARWTAAELLRFMFHATAGVMATPPAVAGSHVIKDDEAAAPVATTIQPGQTVTIQLPGG